MSLIVHQSRFKRSYLLIKKNYIYISFIILISVSSNNRTHDISI